VQSVPITTKVVSLNPVHGEVYSIQHYVIKFVNDLRLSPVSSTNNRHDITEILLKMVFKTINKQNIISISKFSKNINVAIKMIKLNVD